MAKKMVKLIFPKELIKEPVTFRVAQRFNIIPNIRRANVTSEVGELVLELEGDESNIDESVKYLEVMGVKVEPVAGDVLE